VNLLSLRPIHRRTWHGIAVLLAMAAFPALASAQQMYRCGSTYSQTPCGPTATATRTPSDVPPDKAAGSQAGAACTAQFARRRELEVHPAITAGGAAITPASGAGGSAVKNFLD